MDEADLMWASDWNARDDDYSRTDADYYSGGDSFVSRGREGPAVALTDIEKEIIRDAAKASKHGNPKHYKEIARQVIKFYETNGLSLKDAEFSINKAARDGDGKIVKPGGRTLRPDAVVYVRSKNGVPGKYVEMVLEVRNTQNKVEFLERVSMWKEYFPSKVKQKTVRR
jgi:hypothetical protein